MSPAVAPEAPAGGTLPDDGEEPSPPLSRMIIAVVALGGFFLSVWLTMYKLGMVGTIQCTIGGCEKVQSSQWAYFMGLPVASYGVGGYGALFAVAMLGLQPRWINARWVALSLFAMAAVGVAFSLYLTYLEAMVIEAWCQWCLISAALIAVIFLLSLPGLKRAR